MFEDFINKPGQSQSQRCPSAGRKILSKRRETTVIDKIFCLTVPKILYERNSGVFGAFEIVYFFYFWLHCSTVLQ